MLTATIAYFLVILADGDAANDWRTHLPHIIRPLIEEAGRVLAVIIGS